MLSCEKDESLDPRPLLNSGQFVRLDITKDRIILSDTESFFGGLLTNPGNVVIRQEFFIRLTRAGNVVNDYIPYEVVSSFNSDFFVTREKIVSAFSNAGLSILPLKVGDNFRIIGYSYDKNENKVGYTNLSRTVQSENTYKQAYRFNFIITNSTTQKVNNYEP